MEYAEQLLEIYHNKWIFFGTAAVVLLAAAVVMFISFRIPKFVKKWRWILIWTCVFGFLGNGIRVYSMEPSTEAGMIEEEKEATEPKELENGNSIEKVVLEEPEEPIELEDMIAPEVSVVWRDEQGRELKPEEYYQTGKKLFLELTIWEEHLDLEAVRIYLQARNAMGALLDIPEVLELHGKTWADLREKAEQEPLGEEEQTTEVDFVEGKGACYVLREEPGMFQLSIYLETEAIYQISARVQDKFGNFPEGSNEGYLSLGTYCLDRTKPMISQQEGIHLEAKQQTFLEKLIHQVTFGFYCQPDLIVKIEAEDLVSGIGGITYICDGVGGEEEPQPCQMIGVAKQGDGLTCEAEGAKAYTTFSLPDSFQGTIRAQAWDRGGVSMDDWIETKGVLIESKRMHEKTSQAKVIMEGASEGRENFFREDIQLKFELIDTFSGIRSIQLQAGSQREQLNFEEEGEEVQRTVEHILTIPATKNNQNEIPISGCLTDFAGHTTEITEIPVIHIDTSPPRIEVEWLNQEVKNEKYYRENQTAHITIRERNFVPDQVQLQVIGMEHVSLSWSHQPGDGCSGSSDPKNLHHSDTCTWTTDLLFDQDGEYSFGFSCQDAAGNKGSYEKIDTFIIDKTPPVFLVHWDDSQALHDRYYAQTRSAVVEIKERNLNAKDLNVSIEVTDRDKVISPPSLGTLRQWEEDSFRAGITFTEDGRYQMELQCMDLAGNEALVYCSEEFIIDKTPPKLTFENVANCSANRGIVAPRLHALDTNFDSEQTNVSFTGSNGTGQLPAWAKSAGEEGFTILWGDFEQLPENDDLYRIKAKVGDLAGNVTEAELTFSVNRFGSAYELEEQTALLAGPGGFRYASREPELVITEYNPDFLDYYQVTSSREGEIQELKEGQDYQVERAGTKDTWKTYRYRIGKENFEKEGIYLVTLYSEDRAKNVSNNRIKEKSLEFIVDKTGPSVVVTGVKDWERIQGKSLEILADIKDSYALKEAKVYVNGQCTASYDRDMLRELDGIVTCPVTGARAWQTFSVKAWDEAGNLTETKPIRFLITEQIRFRFPGDDEPKVVWAIWVAGILLLAGGGLLMGRGIRWRFQAKEYCE